METGSLPVTTVRPDSAEYHYGAVGENETVTKKILLVNTDKEAFDAKLMIDLG